MSKDIEYWIDSKITEKGFISSSDKQDLIIHANIGSTKFSKWMKRYGLVFDKKKQVWLKNSDTIERNQYRPPSSPNSHIELLDYEVIWNTIQQTPTLSAASSVLDISYQKVVRLNKMMDEYFVEGVLDDWLRVMMKLLSIQEKRNSNHKSDRVLLELRQVFVDYVRNPTTQPAPSNDDIEWVFEQIVEDYEEDKAQDGIKNSTSIKILKILTDAGNKNFHQKQGSWSQFEKELSFTTSCGWKMGMAKSNSGKDNAINRLYTTGVIRSYPEVLVQCLFMDDFFDEITDVYVNEFSKKMRCSPVLILARKISIEEWGIHKILIQHKHPHCPFTEAEMGKFFPGCDIVLVDSEPFELNQGWVVKSNIDTELKDLSSLVEHTITAENHRVHDFSNAYSRWTIKEDEDLVNSYLDGLSITQLSIIHKRKKGGIRSRLKKLGMIEDDDNVSISPTTLKEEKQDHRTDNSVKVGTAKTTTISTIGKLGLVLEGNRRGFKWYNMQDGKSIHLKYSKFYERNETFWYGVKPSNFEVAKENGIDRFGFITSDEGVLIVETNELVRYCETARKSTWENGEIKHFHIFISAPPEPTLFQYGSDNNFTSDFIKSDS